MKVECPNCKTTFNLSDNAVGPDGVDARCGVCKHVFHIPGKKSPDDTLGGWLEQEYAKEHTDSADTPADKASTGQPIERAMAAQASAKPSGPAPASPAAPVKKTVPVVPDSQEESLSGLSSGEWFLIAVLILAVVIGVFLGAAHVFKSWPFAEEETSSASQATQSAPEQPAQPAQQSPAAQSAPAKAAQPAQQPAQHLQYAGQIKFDPYTSYTVDNEKIGAPGAPVKLFVIDGRLTNNSPMTLGRITVEATLLDDRNPAVDARTFVAGPRASALELRTLGKEDLESRLRSEQDIMLTNSQVKPGASVPFMVYFVNIPNSVKNYSLKVKDYSVIPQPPAAQNKP